MARGRIQNQLAVETSVKPLSTNEIIRCPNCRTGIRWSAVENCWVVVKERRRLKIISGRKSKKKICSACKRKTKWLSVDGLCWKCTVKMAKNKPPIVIESEEWDMGLGKTEKEEGELSF